MATTAASEFQSRMQQLDDVLREVESITDPALREKTGQVIQGLMDFHGAAASAIMAGLARAGEPGRQITEQLLEDDAVSSLLLLYQLHPHDVQTRIRAALRKIAAAVPLHGNTLELLEVTPDGAAHIMLQGRHHLCASTTASLKPEIEHAVSDLAPEITAVDFQLDPAAANQNGFVPLERLVSSAAHCHLQGALP